MLQKISLIIACILLAQCCYGGSSEQRMKLIIDTDAGSDDAVGILLALAVEKVNVIAITCTYGNTQEANVEINVLRTMTIANRPDIPIYAGATRPILQSYTAPTYFGSDGFGDFASDMKIIGNIDRSKHAAVAMIELARKYPGEVSVVALGPLTNLALAATLDPNFTQNVKKFYVMGGRIEVPKHIVKPLLQFNFGLDVESTAIFLNSKTQLKTLIISSDLAYKTTIDKKWRQEVLGKSNTRFMKFLNKAEALVLNKTSKWAAADSLTIAATIWPELVTTSYEARMSGVTCNPVKGLVDIDTNGLNSDEKT